MTDPASAAPKPRSQEAVREVDCAIVGGGAAGLSAAINLGRMRRSVIVVDDKDRFRWRHPINNYLGFPDGSTAADLRRLGRRQAARFGARFVIGQVTAAAPDGDRFSLRIEALRAMGPTTDSPDEELVRTSDVVPDGGYIDVVARSVILAMGVRGHFPDFPGRDACVGISLYWCIQCDGYESIDRVVGVVGHDETAVETAMALLDFTSRVTLVAGRAEGFSVPPSRLGDVAAAGIAMYPAGVAEYRNADGRMQALVLEDPARTVVPLEQVYSVRPSFATNDLARQLGVALTESGQIIIDTDQHTNIPGILAAGDITNPHDHQFSAAVHEGNQAACAANYRLYRPEQRAPDAQDC